MYELDVRQSRLQSAYLRLVDEESMIRLCSCGKLSSKLWEGRACAICARFLHASVCKTFELQYVLTLSVGASVGSEVASHELSKTLCS